MRQNHRIRQASTVRVTAVIEQKADTVRPPPAFRRRLGTVRQSPASNRKPAWCGNGRHPAEARHGTANAVFRQQSTAVRGG
jgi:hypothetical protein